MTDEFWKYIENFISVLKTAFRTKINKNKSENNEREPKSNS